MAIGEAGNVKAADHVIEDILYWKFQYPDIRGATDEWETVVNPYHLPKIRCWMHIIESNPALYERLAAALNVQLRLGGVYIADTDLFQRDVTRFLNADIRPIYFVAKQLLRTLPVYFNEVGAEGELRAVSTQIDEICGRRDTLMHFLRKQAHAESSNRTGGLLPRRAPLLDDPRAGRARAVPVRQHDGDGARRAGMGEGPHHVLLALQRRLAVAAGGGAAKRGRRRQRLAADAPPLPRLWTTSSTGCSPLTPADLEGQLALLAARRRPGGATGTDTDRRRVALLRAHATSWSPTSTRCRPTTWARRSAGTCSSRPRCAAGSSARWRRGRRARSRAPATACSTRLSTCCEDLKTIILSPTPSAADREHLPEAPHRRRHPLDLRQLQRAQVRRAGPVVPRREPGRQAARGPRRGRHRALRDPCLPAPHGYGHRALRAGAGRSTASIRAPSAPTWHCSRPASAAATSPSTSTRTCSSSSCSSVTELSTTSDPQSRPGAARRAHQRPSPVRGARHVRGRGRRDGPARGAGVGAGDAGPRPLRGGRPAPDLDAQRAPRHPGPHAHDELRPRAARVAHSQAQGRPPTTR